MSETPSVWSAQSLMRWGRLSAAHTYLSDDWYCGLQAGHIATEALTGIRIVNAFGLQPHLRKAFSKALEGPAKMGYAGRKSCNRVHCINCSWLQFLTVLTIAGHMQSRTELFVCAV